MNEAAQPTAEPRPGATGFESRPWGGFETLQEGPGYKVKRLLVEPGRRLSLQRHRFRAESWIVVSGSPRLIISGQSRRIRPRQMVSVPRGAWHRIENPGKEPVTIIEVQHGPYLGEDDIIRRQDDYGRAHDRPSASAPAEPRGSALKSSKPPTAPPKTARLAGKKARARGSAREPGVARRS